MDYTLHVKIPLEWRDGLNELAEEKCGTTHGEARLAIREHLERTGKISEFGNKKNK